MASQRSEECLNRLSIFIDAPHRAFKRCVDHGISAVDGRKVGRRCAELTDDSGDAARPETFRLLEVADDSRDPMTAAKQRIENR